MNVIQKFFTKCYARIVKQRELRVDRKQLVNNGFVICFHDISTDNRNVFSITKSELVNILEKMNMPFISISELLSGKKGVVVTFDDGFESVYSVAYPILKDKGIPFLVYIATDFIGKFGYLTRRQIKELANDSLCTIGSHMCSHKKTRELTNVEIKNEWMESKTILEEIVGDKIFNAALPYGSVSACSRKSIHIALRNGYDTVATTIAIPYKKGKVISRFVYQNNKKFTPGLLMDK